MNKRGWLAFALVFSAAVSLALFGLRAAGDFVATPNDSPDRADVIIVLGGDSGSRVQTGLLLYRQGFASRILLTGIEGGAADTRNAYLNWRATYLLDHGIPKNALLFDNYSANTWQEAAHALQLMQRHGWHNALVVSDPPHARRLAWAWGKVFKDSGREYRIVHAAMLDWDAAHWWRDEKSAQFVLMELIKLGYYAIHY